MNKQIEQFALKCGAWNQVYGNRMFMIDEHFDIAKFARLIVEECADVGSKFSMAHPEDIRYQIKRHFGVKE